MLKNGCVGVLEWMVPAQSWQTVIPTDARLSKKASRKSVSEQDQWALTVWARGMRAYSQNKSRCESHGVPFGYSKNLVEPESQVVQT